MKDAYYFPHFSNARQDRKIRRLRKQLGIEGYGIYFMILEVLRDQQNFNYPVEDIDLLSDEFNTSDEKVKAVIFNYDLFEIDETKCFFSTKFNLFLEPYLKGKERRKIGGIKGNLIKYNHLTKDQVSKMTDDEIVSFNNSLGNRSLTDSDTDRNASQSKGKESKVKESKVKDKFDFKKSLMSLGIEKDIISDWLKVRSKKKASNTKTAFNALKKQIDISGLSANDCIKISVENSWSGFKSEWIKSKTIHKVNNSPKHLNYDTDF